MLEARWFEMQNHFNGVGALENDLSGNDQEASAWIRKQAHQYYGYAIGGSELLNSTSTKRHRQRHNSETTSENGSISDEKMESDLMLKLKHNNNNNNNNILSSNNNNNNQAINLSVSPKNSEDEGKLENNNEKKILSDGKKMHQSEFCVMQTKQNDPIADNNNETSDSCDNNEVSLSVNGGRANNTTTATATESYISGDRSIYSPTTHRIDSSGKQKRDLILDRQSPTFDAVLDASSFNNNNESSKIPKQHAAAFGLNHSFEENSTPLTSYSPFQTQMQQLLQQHIFTPNQLQQLFRTHSYYFQQLQNKVGQPQPPPPAPPVPQHPPSPPQHCKSFADTSKKQLEQMMNQLQEQLHLNLLQQSNFLNPPPPKLGGSSKKETQMQHTALMQQHQELLQQMQQVQRQYMMQQGLNLPQIPSQRQGKSIELATMMNGNGQLMNGVEDHESVHPLFGNTGDGHGTCKWPSCELAFDDFQSFLRHLNNDHVMDECSEAQIRVQMQVVVQLEVQIKKERDRLQSMIQHLQTSRQQKLFEHAEAAAAVAAAAAANKLEAAVICKKEESIITKKSSSTSSDNYTNNHITSKLSPPASPVHSFGPTRRRISDKSTMSLSGGLPYMLERAGLDVQQEIQRNREFYKNADVRPPFTYASLIRQSIIESPDKQLTLNEIYNWFQNTFCYFRRNAATWKNAVRHNLSLHKCFMRVENVKGAVWTVDEIEFYKRRPQRCSASANAPSAASLLRNAVSPLGNSNPASNPLGNVYADNIPMNFPNFWSCPTNVLDDNLPYGHPYHSRSDRYESESQHSSPRSGQHNHRKYSRASHGSSKQDENMEDSHENGAHQVIKQEPCHTYEDSDREQDADPAVDLSTQN